MCDYCGCRSRPELAAFGGEHERIGLLAQRVLAALDAGTDPAPLLDDLVAHLEAHSAREEARLYPELAAAGVEVEHLHHEHHDVDDGLRSGDPARVRVALAQLANHIRDEEYDLFPAAHQLLDDDAWTRLAP